MIRAPIESAEAVPELSISEQLPHRNVPWFRGGLVFKAHRLVYHSTLGSSVIKKKRRTPNPTTAPANWTQLRSGLGANFRLGRVEFDPRQGEL